LNIAKVSLDQIEVSGFSSLGHGLELSDDLNSLVYTSQSAGEVLHGDVHVLELLGEFLPLVISECCEVQVDQLGREPGELVVQTDAVVASGGYITLLVFRGRLPGVGMDNLHLRIPNCHPNSSIASLQNLI